jgi:peptidoglycan/LPS O-acetylase OafA/YrhL
MPSYVFPRVTPLASRTGARASRLLLACWAAVGADPAPSARAPSAQAPSAGARPAGAGAVRTAQPRLEVLDGLRFVAAMMVVAYHYTAMWHVWRRPAEEVFPSQPAAHGWLGVYLFFLISGFVICMSSWGRGVGAFLVSRAVRLYPAYWLSVIAVSLTMTAWPYLDKAVGWRGTLVNLTMLHEPLGVPAVAEVYWTLWAELRFYLLFTLLVWWGLTYRRVVTFCLLWMGAVTVAKAFVDNGFVHDLLMTRYAPLFTAGIGFYLLYRFRPTLLSWGIVVGSYLLALPAVLYRASREVARGAPAQPKLPVIVLLAVCFLLVAAVAFGWLRWVRGRWLVVLGAMTYPLYLLHLDLGGTVIYLLQRRVPPALLVLLVTAAMLLLAWWVHRYVERPVAPRMKRALLWMSARVRRLVRAPSGREAPPLTQGAAPPLTQDAAATELTAGRTR